MSGSIACHYQRSRLCAAGSGYGKGVLLVRQVFTSKDSSTGMLNLVGSDLTRDVEQMTTIYQKRWNIEVFHNRSNPMPAWPNHRNNP